ncbi:MAG: radical SAM protein [Coriobacteriales bacterium]|jgi:nitrogen fixation protein NifB|nr:radical SAM protein [Coriobacteriales bacterium]
MIIEHTRATKARFDRLADQHPCFASGKPNNKGRIHLPVSPACNIACRFCERSLNGTEQRPGVCAGLLTPREAVELVAEALELWPELSVVGIAGPGDTLATPAALDTFALVKERFPQLLRCMSTNGLLLPDKIDRVVEVGVDTLTVTVNAVDPGRLALINDQVFYQGQRLTGEKGASLLIHKQLAGIAAAVRCGITVKVNTVLVPGVNSEHVGEIARAVAEAGAGLYNLIPLIPHAQMAHFPAPSCAQTDRARAEAERHITVFRHCQHCRADAIGIPGGRDISKQLYQKRLRAGALAAASAANTFSHG